jgi:hypothetical protein
VVLVSLLADDATSGVAATYYTIDGGSQQTYSGSAFSVTQQGTHQIAFWSVDAAGNTEAVGLDHFIIDSAKPSTTDILTGTQGSNGWFTSALVSVALNASDATSGVATTYYTMDGGGQQTYTGNPFVISEDGIHQITFWSVDVAGNIESVESDRVKIDTVTPNTTDALSGAQGDNGWYTSASVYVALNAGDGTSGVAATYYTIDNGGQQTYAGSPVSVSGEGTHQIAFWSVDAAGNTEAARSDHFIIDSVKPNTTDTLAGTQGTNGWFTSAPVSVALNASDSTSGVAITYYAVDGGGQQTYAGSAFLISSEGIHRISFWSVDVAGNTESVKGDTIKIDTVKPNTTDTLSGVQGSKGWFTSAVNVALTASDDTSGVAATYYIIDDGGPQTYTGSAFSVSQQGAHQIALWSVDAAGNAESAELDHFTIDSVKPSTSDSLTGTQGERPDSAGDIATDGERRADVRHHVHDRRHTQDQRD